VPDEEAERLRQPRQINPRDDIEGLEKNLKQARQQFTQSAEELGYQLEVVRTVKPFWKYVTPDMLQGTVASGAAVISHWRDQSEHWTRQSEELLHQVTIASGTATTIASNTVSIEYIHSLRRVVDSERVRRVTAQKDERTFVQIQLRRIDATLGNTYSTVWQYMHLPAFDPLRGPLFLMRQVFDHFLDRLAPDSEVLSQPDFVPDQKLKERNNKGVTRRHRIEFLAKSKLRDAGLRQLVLQSTQNFLDVYDELNQAHIRGELQEDKAKEAVYAASALLATWLRAVTPGITAP